MRDTLAAWAPSKRHLIILGALSEETGLLTKDVARNTDPDYYLSNARICAGAFRSWLMVLKRHGLVRFMDDQKPTVWCRTPEGTVIYQESTQ